MNEKKKRVVKNHANSPLQRNHWKRLQLKGMIKQATGSLHYVSSQIKVVPIRLGIELAQLEKTVDDYCDRQIKKLEQTRKIKRKEII